MSQRDPSVVTFRPKTEIWRGPDLLVGLGEVLGLSLEELCKNTK